ncbi:MAG: hypothetical protein ABI547_04200 [Betaproteobacteria bacterium]
MATEFNNAEKIRVAARDLVETESRAGLTTDPDSLLAILNAIEQSVAAGFRPPTLPKSTRRGRMLLH